MKIGKYYYSPLKLSIFLVILTAWIIFGAIWYNRENSFEEWVVCTYKGDLANYKETIKFRYMYDTLYGYYEEKEINTTSVEEKEEVVKKLEEFGADFKQTDELKYEINKDGLKINVKFYIKTLSYYEFFNEYFKDQDISMETRSSELSSKLPDYNCKKTRKDY